MTDYKSLYFQLFNKITDIIEELKDVQKQAEEKCISEDCETEQKQGYV